MKWTRYEILLPLCYNDGRLIEPVNFDLTNLELMERFSATTTDMITAVGSWKYQGTVYEDQLLRLVVNIPTSVSADEFFDGYKEILKTRFQQIDSWTTSHEIRII